MTRTFLPLLLSSPILLGTAFIATSSAMAVDRSQSITAEAPVTTEGIQLQSREIRLADLQAGVPTSSEMPQPSVSSTVPAQASTSPKAENNPVARPDLYAQKTNKLSQVTSVSELSDVKPTDWAFQAVQSLVERYGCIEGYPDKTFRGNRAATRYELAAALNACLNQISAQLGGITAEDLATIKRLQDEFAAELATLRGRVDTLEARTTELEANQFSTTTKLEGQAVIAPQYGEFEGGDRATFLSRVRLGFNTSFTGKDSLFTQLEVGNGGEDTIGNATGDSPFSEFANTGAVDYAGVDSSVSLLKLHYTFELFPDFAVTIGPAIEVKDYIDTNSYANDEVGDFSSNFFINNPLIITPGANFGAGAVIDWNVAGGPFTIRAAYAAGSPTNAIANEFGGGLFGDPYQGTVEAEFSPGDIFAVRLQYTSAAISDVKYSAFGVNAELTLAKRFGIFGRYGNGTLDKYGSRAGEDDLSPETFMAGVGIRDLFVSDSLLAFAIGQPFIEGDLGTGTQTNYEAFYRFPVNDNVTVTPTISVITDANNDSASNTIYQGVLRTTFSF